ncbi:MAG: type II toxin-antitoxin system VapC family toxin [Chromatiales bacterium]|nr:type II toxin-antitoxin system VapC family toxin [Chromatiales bacterium]
MLLVDTSIWVDHLRQGEPRLVALLEREEVLIHPFVIGELACGNLSNCQELLSLLGELPAINPITHDEALALIEHHQLMGRGLGWIDIHLLGSAMVAGAGFWTRDRRLREAADNLNVAAPIGP